MRKAIFPLIWLLTVMLGSAKITVSSLNPILTDMITQIGGDKVEVIQVMKPGVDVHKFQPSSASLAKIQESQLIFAMGKGLETYLGGIQETLREGQQIIDVGRSIPSQKVDADQVYTCCPAHSKGSVDPHWWHSVKNAERAAKTIGKALEKADPANKSFYKNNSRALQKTYRNLHNWVKSEVSQIPKEDRVVVTAHAAFAYFCKEYGFRAAYVKGLSNESKISTKQFAETVQSLRDNNIKAVFPEKLSNPKMLNEIAKETGAKTGHPLHADCIKTSYKEFIEHNVHSIVNALK